MFYGYRPSASSSTSIPFTTLVLFCLFSGTTSTYMTGDFQHTHVDKTAHRSRSADAHQLTFVVAEETRIGTKIGNLITALHSLSSVSLKTGEKFLEMKTNRYLQLNHTTGDLFVRARIDRESLCEQSGTCCTSNSLVDTESARKAFFRSLSDVYTNQGIYSDCALRMLVIQAPENAKFLEIIVYISDINDNPPSWPQKLLELDIPEHVSLGSTFKLPEATDPDQGPLNTVEAYSLFKAEYNSKTMKLVCPGCQAFEQQNSFTVNEATTFEEKVFSLESQLIGNLPSGAQKFDLGLRVDGKLDREVQSTYYLVLFAVDGVTDQSLLRNWQSRAGTPDLFSTDTAQVRGSHTGTLTIRVNVVDINDNPPVFLKQNPSVTIPETTEPGTVIYQAIARDLDSSDFNKLIYRISTSATPEVLRCFQMNQSTGELQTIRRLSYRNASVLSEPESQAQDRLIKSSANPPLGYLIPIEVSDRIHQATTSIQVRLTQVNTIPPLIHVLSYLKTSPSGDQIWVPEDTPSESILAMINVEDPDSPFQANILGVETQKPTNKPECYTHHENFEIRPFFTQTVSEFKLVLRHSLDRELKESHSVVIECWDAGAPPLSSKVTLLINVEDVDDSAPAFDRPLYLATVREGVPPNTAIIKVHASDPDVGKNAEIFYRIVNQVHTYSSVSLIPFESTQNLISMISIDQKTGEIVTEVTLDREAIQMINCTVEASNSGKNVLNSSLGHQMDTNKGNEHKAYTYVVITIEDVNDCKPQFNATSYEFAVEENKQPHFLIGRVLATDCDAEPQNNAVRYAMRPVPGPIGQLANLYVTVGADGSIYTHNARLDREETPILSFEVVATDSGHPTLSSFVSVLIRVLDVNDNSPVWLFPKQFASRTTVNISQHATAGLQIAQLKSADPDEGANGEITYSIVHGNENGFFEVDPISGALYLAKSLLWFPYNESSMRFTKIQNGTEITDVRKHQSDGRNKPQNDIYVHKLILKANDRGVPSRFNTTVLNIAIFQSPDDENILGGEQNFKGQKSVGLHQQTFFTREENRRIDHDLVIIIILIALTSVISFILIMAICLIRYRRTNGATRVQRNPQCCVLQPVNSDGSGKKERKRWWQITMNPFTQRGTLQSIRQNEPPSMIACQDLYTLQRGAEIEVFPSEESKPGGYLDTIGYLREQTDSPQRYYTLRSRPYDSRVVPKTAGSHSLDDDDANVTVISSADKLSNAYVIQVNPTQLDSPYSLLKPRPCTSMEYTSLHYQPLCPNQNTLDTNAEMIAACGRMNSPHELKASLRPGTDNTMTTDDNYFSCSGRTLKTFVDDRKCSNVPRKDVDT